MCGIIGVLRRSSSSPILTAKHLDLLRHRGPDDRGIYSNGRVSLGHTRLSIIDLSPLGAQPMTYMDGRYVITFNGEIYNYLELRDELSQLGYPFASRSDTEVILAAYHHYGPKCVERFRGMFAFAIWDVLEQRLFLARDRCGERPLIYWRNEDQFIFASEFKALLPLLPAKPALDPAVVDMYMHFQYVPEPFTLLQDVRKLPRAHRMIIRADTWEAEPECYWRFEEVAPLEGDPAFLIRNAIEEAVILTLRSDVPVAVPLSGGIDSGAIAAVASRHYGEPMHTFSVGYPGRPEYDEREQAVELAKSLGLIWHEIELPTEDFTKDFPAFVRAMDEPIADPAAFAHYAVPKAAAEQGIKVLLGGIGGDELFWGYPWARDCVSINEKYRYGIRLPVFIRKILASGLLNHLPNWPAEATEQWKYAVHPHTPQEQLLFYETTPDFRKAFSLKRQWYGEAMRRVARDAPFIPTTLQLGGKKDIPLQVLRLLFDTWLVSNCLSLGDRISMAAGVETRLPFLDYKLIELVMSLRKASPDHMCGHKAWMRMALKGVLPDEVLNRPKRGFQPPVWEWLSGVVVRYRELLEGGHLVRSGILSALGAADIINNGTNDWPVCFLAYKFVLAECWCREFLDN